MKIRCARCSGYNTSRARFCHRCGRACFPTCVGEYGEAHESIAGAHLVACVAVFGFAACGLDSADPVQRLLVDGAMALALWCVLWEYLGLPAWSAFAWGGGWVTACGWHRVASEWLPHVDPLFLAIAHGLVLGFFTWAALQPAGVSCLWILQTAGGVLLAYLLPCILWDVFGGPVDLPVVVTGLMAGSLLGIAQGPCLLSARTGKPWAALRGISEALGI